MSAYFRIWWFALAAKFVLAALLPLSNDEAYYWVWGHHLQWSYFDHPAGVAILFWLGQPFEWLHQFGLVGAVRWPGVLLAHSSFLLLRGYFSDRISEKSQAEILLVLVCSPFFGVGSLVITPDIPHVFTWLLGLLAFQQHSARPRMCSALALGAAVGVGFCAKYHMVLFFPLAILALAAERNWRALRPAFILVGIFGGVVASTPVWGWNLMNDWASFRFQLGHGLNREALQLSQIAEQVWTYIGAQAALLSPLVLLYAWRQRESRAFSPLHWFGWGPVLFFLFTSSRSPVEANWPIAGHLSLLALASLNDSRKRVSQVMIGIWCVSTALVLVQAFAPEKAILTSDPTKLKTWEFVRFNPLIPLAESDQNFFASSYQMAGALSYATGRTVGKLKGINRPDFFDFHPSGIPTSDDFTIAIESDWPWPAWLNEAGYRILSTKNFDRFRLVQFSRSH